jgi:predicted transcriptional regulator
MDFRNVTCYLLPMNAKLQNLFERIAALPDELLGEIEQSIDEIERWRGDVFRLTDEERAAVRKGMEAARRGEFVTDEELAAFYRRHGG